MLPLLCDLRQLLLPEVRMDGPSLQVDFKWTSIILFLVDGLNSELSGVQH